MECSHKTTLNKDVIPTGDPFVEIRLDPVNILPVELILYIFSYLTGMDLGRCELVTKNWNRLTKDEYLKAKVLRLELKELEAKGFRFIGEEIWNQCLGDVGEVPPLPEDIIQILNSPCPWLEGKKMFETHMLVLIPATVNGNPLTLNTIGVLVKTPKMGNKTEYQYIGEDLKIEHGSIAIEKSYWVLMTKDVLEGSRGKSRKNQLALAASQTGYQAPTLREAIFSIFMRYVSKEERLFSKDPWTLTCCQEQSRDGRKSVVGAFAPAGLYVSYCYDDFFGVAALRKF